MRMDALEKRMRQLEYFHGMQVLSHAWIIIRLDGHNFSRLTEDYFDKPFDPKFQETMLQVAQAVLTEFQGIYASTHSDEISLLLPRDCQLFDRRLEKLVSLSAGLASATFARASARTAWFDSRLWLGVDASLVLDYFRWRQADGQRCALNTWCYWKLRQAGYTKGQANQLIERQSWEAKSKILEQYGVVFHDLPACQRCGFGLYWEEYTKTGYNPKTKSQVTACRHRIKVESELPAQEAYTAWLSKIIGD